MGRTLTLRQWGIEYEPDQQQVSRALKALGLTDAEGVATPGTDDVGGPKASQISELRRTAKWHDPPVEVREEDDLLTGEELKLFQSVVARFNFLAMDRPDLLYSVKELMRKMASPRTQSLTALKRVARYTIKYPRMNCRYPAQAILSQEAYGVLLLPLHSNRIDCCLSLSCIERSLWK